MFLSQRGCKLTGLVGEYFTSALFGGAGYEILLRQLNRALSYILDTTMQRLKCLFRQLVALIVLVYSSSLIAEPAYKINPGDVLRVDIWNEESLTREVVVRPDGYISFPLAGDVLVGGDTTVAAEGMLAQALGKFLKDSPTVTVAVFQLSGNKIYILGKVNRPGEYPINRPTDVMQALAIAGGLNTFAAENSINILRRAPDGTQQAIPFEYGEVKSGNDLDTNLVLHSGDIVVVR